MVILAISLIAYFIVAKKIFFLVALAMGYAIASNAWVETQARTNIAASYANSRLGMLSSLGGLTSWICPIAGAYLYSASSSDRNFLDALLFMLCVFGGAFVAGVLWNRSMRYIISPFVLVINPILTYSVYAMSA